MTAHPPANVPINEPHFNSDCKLYTHLSDNDVLQRVAPSITGVLKNSGVLCNWLRNSLPKIKLFSIKGSLCRSFSAWRRLGAHPYILDVVRNGYRLPFKSVPPPFYRKNNLSARLDPEFVLEAVAELLWNGFAEVVSVPPFCVNPLQVAKQSNGKKRLIIDLTFVNQFVYTESFKMDTLQVAAPFFPSNGWGFSYDMSRGYNHLCVHPDFHTFLGFSFSINGIAFYAQYTVCPFGLSPIPRLFTKVLKPILAHWRQLGMIHFLYLDDGLGLASSQEECVQQSEQVQADLLALGFHTNPEKCHWVPSQKLTWLGFQINLQSHQLIIPSEKVDRAIDALRSALAYSYTSCRQMLRLAGLISSLSLVYGTAALLLTKPFHVFSERQLDAGFSYDARFPIPPTLRENIQATLSLLKRLPPYRNLAVTRPTLLCFSDASGTGGGAVLHQLSAAESTACALPAFIHQMIRSSRSREQPFGDSHLHPILDSGHLSDTLSCLGNRPSSVTWPRAEQLAIMPWSDDQSVSSSTWRELKVVEFGLKALIRSLRGQSVLWCTDNQAVESILRKGSTKPDLQALALEIFSWVRKYAIQFTALWIPRHLNETADDMSRFLDVDDWSLVSPFFDLLNVLWGPHTVDCFSSDRTAQLPRFFSRFACPGAEVIDAFTVNWSGENCWLVPPPRLIPLVIRHLRLCSTVGTLIVPYWCSSPFWPLLFANLQPRDFVVKYLMFPNAARYICPGPQSHSIFHPDMFRGSLIAVRICFS